VTRPSALEASTQDALYKLTTFTFTFTFTDTSDGDYLVDVKECEQSILQNKPTFSEP